MCDHFLFGIEQNVDYVAASFTRRAQDIIDMRSFLNAHGGEGIRILPEGMPALGMILPVGGFLTLACVIAAMQYFKKYPKKFLPVLVTALAECIHIVPKAASVDLSTGDKGIVLIENTRDFMRPVVLRLSDNQIYDLSDKNVYQEMQVTDIMKTMDNRVAMDEETLKQFVPDEKLRQLTQEFRRKLAAGKK